MVYWHKPTHARAPSCALYNTFMYKYLFDETPHQTTTKIQAKQNQQTKHVLLEKSERNREKTEKRAEERKNATTTKKQMITN